MIYVCPRKDSAVREPCSPCICGMDTLPVFKERVRLAERFKDADKRVTLADLNRFAIPACTDNK